MSVVTPFRTAVLTAFAAVALLAGCEAVIPAAKTSEVFAAAPWRAGERLEYRLLNNSGEEVARAVLTARADGERLILGQSYTETKPPAGATPARDEVALAVDAKTLRPLSGGRETSRRDGAGGAASTKTTWTYAGDPARLTVRAEGAGAPSEATLTLRPHAYDNESSLWLWRGIAFAEGYAETYLSANAIERTQQVVSLQVPQREQIEVPAGRFDTWRIVVRAGRAARTAWISSAAPHQVVRWDTGDVVFELTKAE